MRFYPLEKLLNLREGYRRKFRIDHLELLLVQQEGRVSLFESRCPHREQPLDAAVIARDTVECPAHGYRFSLRDGVLADPADPRCRGLRVFSVTYRGTDLGLMLED